MGPPAVDSVAIKAAIQHERDSTYIAFFLQQYTEDFVADGEGMIRGERLFSDAVLPVFYDSFGFELIWDDSLKLGRALKALSNAHLDGLDAEDYHLQAIVDLLSQNSEDYEIRAGIDLLITDGLIRFGTQLLNGKTDARNLEPTLTFEERLLSEDMMHQMAQDLKVGNVSDIITRMRPRSRYYAAMMKGLAHYQMLADSGGWRPIALSVQKIEPGDTIADLISIRERMRLEGDLAEEDAQVTDSLAQFYDLALLKAVEHFQVRHGLNPDGVIGKGTMAAMNTSAQEKVDLLKINMERLRWIHPDLDANFVLVNIAGFDLRLVLNDSLAWQTRVVTGKVATATPVFKDEIQYIEFNPYWTVPFSISNDEILPILKKNPDYLRTNDMELLSMSGDLVASKNVDFNSYRGKMPFMLRQGPGDGNALGRVKFLFPNKFSIYLHDTPSKSLFSREERAFSHGCIRVADPMTLAEKLLADQGITRTQIDSIVGAKANKRITLNQKVPILIMYSTAFADGSTIYFYKDIYKRDEAIRKTLDL